MSRQNLPNCGRILKVRGTYYTYQLERKLPGEPVPTLLLKGYWLKDLGIDIGQQVQVKGLARRIEIVTV